MDDLWEESNEDDYEKRLREKEFKRLQSQYATTGYREGATEAKENALQGGFNEGFQSGSQTGIKFGRLVGIISAMDLLFSQKKSLISLALSSQISTLSESLAKLSAQRTKTFNSNSESTQQEDQTMDEAKALIFQFILSRLDEFPNYSEKEKILIFQFIENILLPYETQGILDLSFFDLFGPLLSHLDIKEATDSISKILHEIADQCNRKEVFMLISESLESTDLSRDKILLLIDLLKKVILRFPDESRSHFLESSFGVLNKLVKVNPRIKEDIKDLGTKAISFEIRGGGHEESDFNTDEPLKPLENFLQKVVDVLPPIVQSYTKIRETLHGRKQRKHILEFLLKLFEYISFTTLDNPNSHYRKILDRLVSLIEDMNEDYLVLYKYPTSHNINEDIEDEDEDPVPLLSTGGLACFFYSSFCIYQKPLLPSILSPIYIFEHGVPFIQFLLQHPRTCLKALDFIRTLIQTEPGRIIRENVSETPFFDLFQSLINFMVNCPVQNIRTLGFKVTNAIIDQFEDKTRLELIQAIIQSCPYPSTSGLFITRLKDEAIKQWPLNSEAKRSVFTTSEILESFPLLTSENDVFASLDIIMPVLNLIRFLLVKDKNTNYTSIWSKERQKKLRKDFLEPLEETVENLLKSHLDPAQKKQEKKKMTTGGSALPTITEKEFEHSHSNAIYTLELIRDTLQRVKELIKGSDPVSGKPELPISNSNSQV